MKITTWNVNGYRAVLRKEALGWLWDVDPDVLCLQEIKVQLHQLGDEEATIEGYEGVWNPAERKGYSGTANFYKECPLGVEKGMGFDEFDNEGRLIRSDYKGFYLYNIYFPNGGQGNKRVPFKLDFYEKLLEVCDGLRATGKEIIIAGDFNTAHNEIDLANPEANRDNTGFLPEERAWIDKYLSHGFVDVFRELYPERVSYTYWSYRTNARIRNVGWRLDYFLVTEGLVDRVADVLVHDEIMGSDHCPVSLILKD